MADPKSTKTSIEQALVDEVVDTSDYGRSFGRIFNKDNGDFSRIFSRGNPQLAEISAHDLASMDDAAFKKFSDRLRSIQDILQKNPLEGITGMSDSD